MEDEKGIRISKETGGAYADVKEVIKDELKRIREEASLVESFGSGTMTTEADKKATAIVSSRFPRDWKHHQSLTDAIADALTEARSDERKAAVAATWGHAIETVKKARPMNGQYEHDRNTEPWKSVFDLYYKLLSTFEAAKDGKSNG